MLGVPDEADAVVVNLTVTQATGYGYLTAFPCGGDPPNTSNVNYNVGVDRANAVDHGARPARLAVRAALGVERPRDRRRQRLARRYDQGSSTAPARKRIADSRDGLGGWTGTFAPGRDPRRSSRGLTCRPDSRVAVLGVTSTASSGAGFITVQPCGGQAEVSNLNFVGGVDITNLAVVPARRRRHDLRDDVRAHPHRRRRVRRLRRPMGSRVS